MQIISTATPKYHVYFSPKNSIHNNLGTNKTKSKRKATDDNKHDREPICQSNVSVLSTEQTKTTTTTTAPMTRRSINTRSVPNVAAEQEEDKSRK